MNDTKMKVFIGLLILCLVMMAYDAYVNSQSIEKCSKAWRMWNDTGSTCEAAAIFCKYSIPELGPMVHNP